MVSSALPKPSANRPWYARHGHAERSPSAGFQCGVIFAFGCVLNGTGPARAGPAAAPSPELRNYGETAVTVTSQKPRRSRPNPELRKCGPAFPEGDRSVTGGTPPSSTPTDRGVDRPLRRWRLAHPPETPHVDDPRADHVHRPNGDPYDDGLSMYKTCHGRPRGCKCEHSC